MSEERLSPKTVEALVMLYEVFKAPFKIVAFALNGVWDVIKIKQPEQGVDMTIGVDKTGHPKP
ncbi:MAG: hypothetical protein G01um101416_336 [Microgenomates group bacterium Gr01-1014_16]|nr:MAG: hypothetical protein G01um101416_336 [Microgenomates group bacterium Gr01-1014_16]